MSAAVDLRGACPFVMLAGKRRGERCGRAIRGFVAPGHGRCGLHCTEGERLRTRAVLEAVASLRALRDLPDDAEADEGREREQEASGDDEANAGAGFELDWPGDGFAELAADEDVPP